MKHAPNASFQVFETPQLAGDKLDTLSVLGLPIVSAMTHSVIQVILSPQKKQVSFLNAHYANMCVQNPKYRTAVKQADYILPDGIGIELAARLDGKQLAENLNGTDFVPALLNKAAALGLSVYLFGARPGTAIAAAQTLSNRIPDLIIAGTRDGYEEAKNSAETIKAINASKADIVLVAMGAPKQELWIAQHKNELSAPLVMGVGALFEFLAGNVKRAPKIIRRIRMEWAWRLANEPRRLAKRYLVGNFTFLARAATYTAKRRATKEKIKRLMDLTIAGSALLVLSPILGLVAAAIRLDSKGSVFFRQTRIGKNGQHFEMYKFRSMNVDAEGQREKIINNSDRTGICFKAKSDPRITRVGKFLRKWSVDELPQIVNVLMGDMSIVGPRPALPEEVENYPTHALERLKVKPGITGIWQVSGRADIGFDKMVDLDLAYVRSRSTILDLVLIAVTFRAVLSSRGSY